MDSDNFIPKDWIVLDTYRGSISHGTHNPNPDDSVDDIDRLMVFIPPLDYYLGRKTYEVSKGVKEYKVDRDDVVAYELRKFIGLLARGNPNVIGTLWLKPEMYLYKSDVVASLFENRELFLTQELAKSFFGYANGQLKRVDNALQIESGYKGYMGAKRKALREQFGYDVKYASHVIRLLRMLEEFLDTGELNVYRDLDASELRDIKIGKWSYDEFNTEALRLIEVCEAKRDKMKRFPLFPDETKVNQLCMSMMTLHFFGAN